MHENTQALQGFNLGLGLDSNPSHGQRLKHGRELLDFPGFALAAACGAEPMKLRPSHFTSQNLHVPFSRIMEEEPNPRSRLSCK